MPPQPHRGETGQQGSTHSVYGAKGQSNTKREDGTKNQVQVTANRQREGIESKPQSPSNKRR